MLADCGDHLPLLDLAIGNAADPRRIHILSELKRTMQGFCRGQLAVLPEKFRKRYAIRAVRVGNQTRRGSLV